jgi:nickel superoxide dismutase
MDLKNIVSSLVPTLTAEAHCDVPCGIYEPVPAKIAAKTVQRMIEQEDALELPDWKDKHAVEHYLESITRRTVTKERHADLCKHELYTLWSDFFKPEHLVKFPDLHDMFWKAVKLCSKVKQEGHLEDAKALVEAVDGIAKTFYAAKGDPERYTAYAAITDKLY